MKQDNSTEKQKVMLRRSALRLLEEAPVVLETHGGYGTLYRSCYQDVRMGVVFDMERDKARALARQRPTWAVYHGDCIPALAQGAGAHLSVNVLDLDPYGNPWPTMRAFFESERPWPERLVVVVNDGLRQKIQRSGGWDMVSVAPMVGHFGNDFRARYLEACQWYLKKIAAQAGYGLSRWTGYYCGDHSLMTHYLALFIRREEPAHVS